MRVLGRLLKAIVKLALTAVVLLAAVYGGLYVYFTRLRPIDKAVQAVVEERTRQYHVHPLSYDQIPDFFRQAVIATEDRRFWWDPGIDPIGIVRSLYVDIEADGYVEGGSTITQQLVDNTLLSKEKTLARKLRQMVYAVGIYDTMSKKQTLTDYVNMIYFGHGAYGLYNAAQTYFGLPPGALNEGELSLLAGLPNGPSLYDPFVSLQRARARQWVVLENMVDAGRLSEAAAEAIYHQPLRLKGGAGT
ncbi:transglycosylase domain-containing protein [Alicyclobacillus shizuokensis]|uniref:transglycosylase domain-containing protein n=1 Tax=Alicyclobacillus shizuokensis TaxID=392014 RepID=UPI000AAEC11F|nr:biosynthetic peptidoglycan transglycosylase [Alicyclobacillus shizuokensis]MCL6626729.1 transglycosylase domain-containing protein [Alicyclobacillus shizuokensis]